jgi:hypothetical protein
MGERESKQEQTRQSESCPKLFTGFFGGETKVRVSPMLVQAKNGRNVPPIDVVVIKGYVISSTSEGEISS